MPADRLLHPRLGHSHKVTMLTDLEFRTWIQYMLSADDFGVMRASSVTLQADSDALGARKPRMIQGCLEAIIKSGLLLTFEHQGRRYVCQSDWQDYQHVGYPRSTVNPIPPADVLAKCSLKTREHFGKHSAKIRQMDPESLPNISETFDKDLNPSRARETATANGNGSKGLERGTGGKPPNSLASTELADRAAAFLLRYQALHTQYRAGAQLLVSPRRDFDRACDLCRMWDNARLEKLAILLLTTDDEWVEKAGRGFGVFAARASWCDDRLKQWEATHGAAV